MDMGKNTSKLNKPVGTIGILAAKKGERYIYIYIYIYMCKYIFIYHRLIKTILKSTAVFFILIKVGAERFSLTVWHQCWIV